MNKIPVVIFKDDHINTILLGLALDQVQKVVYTKFIPNIKAAVEKNRKECIFCFVDDYQVVLPQTSFKQALNTVEQYFLSKEDFDTCIILRDISNKIK